MKDIIQKIRDFYNHPYFRFAIAITIFILWVIWVGNYWLLIFGPIIFDMYITKKVNWTFWKKRDAKNPWFIEWLDALLFAVFFVTLINIFLFQNYKIPTGSMEKTLMIGDHLYVSKVSYGPRIPNTPLSFPFTQHTMPGTQSMPSYLTWIQWEYKRILGFGEVKRNDKVVFNFPEGDTVMLENQAASYYTILFEYANQIKQNDINRKQPLKNDKEYYQMARNYVWQNFTIVVRPMDRTDNYIKRCVAIGGDTLHIIDAQVYINGEEQEHFPFMQYRYKVTTDGSVIPEKVLDKLGIYHDENQAGERSIHSDGIETYYYLSITEKEVESLKQMHNVKAVTKELYPKDYFVASIFPHNENYKWNVDNFGPLYIPKAGATIAINLNNICLYERVIDMYEGNDFKVIDSTIYINGKPATEYTFKYNYYFMMGDNRHSSSDSRYWGLVPETHIIGKPKFIWLSLNKLKKFPFNIRFERMFRGV